MIESRLLIIRDTYLSRKPATRSFTVGLLSMACLAAFSVLYWTNAKNLSTRLEGVPAAVFDRNEYWRLLTGILIHADIRHLLSNIFVFGFLAYLLYGYYGWIVYPGLMALLGVLTNLLSLAAYPPNTRLVGASGMIYAMSGFWLLLYLLIERRLSIPKRLVRCVGFAMITLLPTAIDPSVSYRSHFTGFLLGSATAVIYFLLRKKTFRMTETLDFED
jgi:rhomboid protease GluP